MNDNRPEVIVVEVPAEPSFVSIMRTTIASLGARLDFTVDDIEDLRIIVDEAASLLLERAATPGTLRCRYVLEDQELTLVMATVPQDRTELARDGFAWMVLSALTDQCEGRLTDDGIELEVSRGRRVIAASDEAVSDRG